ncbi:MULTISPECIES: oligosaccharide flippase family protein [Flavobacterium]|uniref:Oligosaccharide flippase family protein n=1 Tax=Flavobacterium algoritolerans TaxID=3041254 RepID=A0ABT6V7B0_9FLAO|nr:MULTISPECIES: oligosaccharide flippase family protein [Flavobacterium]MDI5887092.1 oligosaccharide flippase family protein [Flavobacterium yafengii]MDI5894118.1 oligosaccharide flippase family protein [Flavobacterium algoritolerans]
MISNFFYIGVMKFLNIGSKYILVGYLIRVLGENGYGTLTWIDSIVQYFIMLINFGFDLYAAKYVVENKNNPKKLNEAISAIYYIKGILLLISFVLLIPLTFNTEINTVINLIFLMLVMGIGEVLTPIWFFQGIEKMKTITIITFFSKLILVLLTFFFIKNSTDIHLYILFLVFTNIIWGFFGFLMMKKEASFKFVAVTFDLIKNYLKEGYLFFIGKFSTFLFNLGTVFLIGYLFTKGQVAGFDIAIKIVFVFIIPFEVLQQALFPVIVRGVRKSVLRNITVATFIISTATSILLYVFSENVIVIFGGTEMYKYGYVLDLVLVLIPIVSLTIVVGNCILVAKGYYKQYNWSLIVSAMVFVSLLIVLKTTDQLNFLNVILIRVLADFIQLLIRFYYNFKFKII